MKKKENGKLDRFAFALGSITLAAPFTAIPIVPADRINAVWDERLAARKTGPDFDPGHSRISCPA